MAPPIYINVLTGELVGKNSKGSVVMAPGRVSSKGGFIQLAADSAEAVRKPKDKQVARARSGRALKRAFD